MSRTLSGLGIDVHGAIVIELNLLGALSGLGAEEYESVVELVGESGDGS